MSITEYVGIARKHLRSAPVNVVRLTYDLGMVLYETGDWPETVSGMIQKDRKGGGKSGYAIIVNDKHCEARRRFTIAHEIGHFVLHPDLIGDSIGDDGLYRSHLPNIREVEANRFAANLLMPTELIEKAEAAGVDTIPDFARIFAVSRSTMSARLGVPFEIRESAVGDAGERGLDTGLAYPAGSAPAVAQRRPGSA